MAAKFHYQGTTYTLSREPDLGGGWSRSRRQDVLELDSGGRSVFTRRTPERRVTVRFMLADQSDREIIERFFYEVAQGARRFFDFEVEGTHKEPPACGAVVGGSTITAGVSIGGATLKCGQWILHDRNYFARVRFAEDSLLVVDAMGANSDIEFELVQELPA